MKWYLEYKKHNLLMLLSWCLMMPLGACVVWIGCFCAAFWNYFSYYESIMIWHNTITATIYSWVLFCIGFLLRSAL